MGQDDAGSVSANSIQRLTSFVSGESTRRGIWALRQSTVRAWPLTAVDKCWTATAGAGDVGQFIYLEFTYGRDDFLGVAART